MRVFFMTNAGTCPQDPCVFPGFVQGECEDYNVEIIGDFVSSFPNDTPDSSAILPRGNIYDGATPQRPKPSIMTLRAGRESLNFTIKHWDLGPLPLRHRVSRRLDSYGSFERHVPCEFCFVPNIGLRSTRWCW
ncbi:MAG: hypothetical protein IPH85_14340 [Ignavibacteria bacterium]|nr:hypothetical protein [Ignavibacteria bacterium]